MIASALGRDCINRAFLVLRRVLRFFRLTPPPLAGNPRICNVGESGAIKKIELRIFAMAPQRTSPRFVASARGFTLIELLTVIAIIGVLAGILIPVTGKVRNTAKGARCASNMRQICQALVLFTGDNKAGRFPNGGNWDRDVVTYMNLGAIYAQPPATRASAEVFVCPNDTEPRSSSGGIAPNPRSYVASCRQLSLPGRGIVSRLYDTDDPTNPANSIKLSRRISDLPAPSKTILLAEFYTETNGVAKDTRQFDNNFHFTTGWTAAAQAPKKVGSTTEYYHGSRMNYGFADGHVEALTIEQLGQSAFSTGGRWQALEPTAPGA